MTSRYLSSLSNGISENINTLIQDSHFRGAEFLIAPLYTPLHTPHKKNIKKHKKTCTVTHSHPNTLTHNIFIYYSH